MSDDPQGVLLGKPAHISFPANPPHPKGLHPGILGL
jgi:hypothetical protein